MSKSKETRETARVIVNPLFAWSAAVLKGGEMMLDSMQAVARNAKTVRVAVLQDSDVPARTLKKVGVKPAKATGRSRRAKARRR
jgi:hypothetical protein